MALETKTKTIDGFAVSVTQLPAKRAMRLFHRLTQIGIPGFVQSLGGVVGSDSQIDFKSIGASLEGVMSKLDVEQFEGIRDELLYATLVDDKPLLQHMDGMFAGKISTIYKVMLFALEANYADFFDAARGAFTGLGALGAKVSAFGNRPSHGPSGA